MFCRHENLVAGASHKPKDGPSLLSHNEVAHKPGRLVRYFGLGNDVNSTCGTPR